MAEKELSVTQESPSPKLNLIWRFPLPTVSFKEQSNNVADLSEHEKRSLEDLKHLVRDAIDNDRFSTFISPINNSNAESQQKSPQISNNHGIFKKESADSPDPDEIVEKEENNGISDGEIRNAVAFSESGGSDKVSVVLPHRDVQIWGVSLLKDARTDTILLKFLRARYFNVSDAFLMLENTLRWRKEFGIDQLVNEDLSNDMDKVVFMYGSDRNGHPVCYNAYSEFQDKSLYHRNFSDRSARLKFTRWRIQHLERSIRELNFDKSRGDSTIFHVNDLKNSPAFGKSELRSAIKQILVLLQDNYPEFVVKQVFINVPWWFFAMYSIVNPFLAERTKSKFVFCGPSKSAQTLFKYISPEQVPIQYGGMGIDPCESNPDFGLQDPVTEMDIIPGSKQIVEIHVSEECEIVWEVRVVGWRVGYGVEFEPFAENEHTLVIRRSADLHRDDAPPVLCDRYAVGAPGKIVLTFRNLSSHKKTLFYRHKEVIPPKNTPLYPLS